jgi:hypothetical protein
MTSVFRRAAAAVLISTAALACRTQPEPPIAENRPVAYVDADGSHETQVRDTLHNAHPHMRFADGQITPNDRCPVRKAPLNLKLPGLYVNGRPIGFC